MVLAALARARAQQAGGLGAGELSARLRTDPLQTEPILETLVAINWVGRLDEKADPRYVLLCDPATTKARPLVSALLIEPSAPLQGFWQHAGFDSMLLNELIRS